MPNPTKIVTCCYCGSRAALVLRGRVRHELSCASCGAPLHELKMIRADVAGTRKSSRSVHSGRSGPMSRRTERKRTRSLSQRFMAELREVAEDVLDEVFDLLD